MRDPYEVLGVPRTASAAEIKKAYRRLAKAHHPDQNRDDPKAKDRFAEINGAYEILGEEPRRKAFDRGEIDAQGKPRFQYSQDFAGAARPGPGPGPGHGDNFETFEFGYGPQGPFQRRKSSAGGFFDGTDFADIFASAFGAGGRAQGAGGGTPGGGKGSDIEVTASVSLEDIARRRPARVSLPGGRTVEVAIPDEVGGGRKMRLRGQGRLSPGSAQPGDVLLTLEIAPHPLFRREGRDLYLDLPLALDEAVLGASVRVPTLTGAVEMAIPAGSNDGQTLRLRGKGLTLGKVAGDLFVTLRIRLPEADDRLRSFAEALREAGSYRARGPKFDV